MSPEATISVLIAIIKLLLNSGEPAMIRGMLQDIVNIIEEDIAQR